MSGMCSREFLRAVSCSGSWLNFAGATQHRKRDDCACINANSVGNENTQGLQRQHDTHDTRDTKLILCSAQYPQVNMY